MYGISQNPKTKDYIIVIRDGYCVKCDKEYINTKYKWCKSCQINYFKNNFTSWTSGNNKIDDLIQRTQLKVSNHNDTIIEWIPYDQFSNIKEIGEVDFAKVYSAMWKDGPLNYDINKMKLNRIPDRNVSLKCLQIINVNEFLTKVRYL
jgi:hypothetical protein